MVKITEDDTQKASEITNKTLVTWPIAKERRTQREKDRKAFGRTAMVLEFKGDNTLFRAEILEAATKITDRETRIDVICPEKDISKVQNLVHDINLCIAMDNMIREFGSRERAADVLVEAVKNGQMSYQGAEVLAKLGVSQSQVEKIMQIAEDRKLGGSRRDFAVMTLEVVGSPIAIPCLIRLLEDDTSINNASSEELSNRISDSAARALGKIGDSTALDPLKKLLGKRSFYTRDWIPRHAITKILERQDGEKLEPPAAFAKRPVPSKPEPTPTGPKKGRVS